MVAAEVRQLAGRCAAAAREVKGVVASSMQSVQAGTALADGAGRSMAGIVQSIQGVAGAISEIAAVTQAQTREIARINAAMSGLDEVTQQNSTLVEESAAASEGLREQAQELAALISRFVLPEPRSNPPAAACSAGPAASTTRWLEPGTALLRLRGQASTA